MDPDSPAYDQTYDPESPYYIDRRETSETGDQVEDQAEQRVDQQIEDGGFFDRLIGIFTRNGRVDDAYAEQMSDQANQLAQGVSTRPAPAIPGVNYLAYDHPKLKDMVTTGVNPGEVGTAGDMWINAGNAMVRFQTEVAGAINNSEADWQGKAGDAARRFMAGIGNWVGTAGQSAQLAGTQTGLHAQAAETAKNTMPDPVPWDRNAAIADIASASNPFDAAVRAGKQLAQHHAHQEAHQRAAEVVSRYDANLGGASTMPAFSTPPTMGGGGTKSVAGAIDGGKVMSANGFAGPKGGDGAGLPGGSGASSSGQPIGPVPGGGDASGSGSAGGSGIPGSGGTGGPGSPGGPGSVGGPGSSAGSGSGGSGFPGGIGSSGGSGAGGAGYPGGIGSSGGSGAGYPGGAGSSGGSGAGYPGGAGSSGGSGAGNPGGAGFPGGAAGAGYPGGAGFPGGAGAGVPGFGPGSGSAYPGFSAGQGFPGVPDDATSGAGYVPGAPCVPALPGPGGPFGPGAGPMPGVGQPTGAGFPGAGAVPGFGPGGSAGMPGGAPGIGPVAGNPGAGSRSGVGGGVRGEVGAGGRGPAGPSRSAAGLGGVPIGGGRGAGNEDGVHKQPDYLVEPDVESLFGTDELTAPPVIGVG